MDIKRIPLSWLGRTLRGLRVSVAIPAKRWSSRGLTIDWWRSRAWSRAIDDTLVDELLESDPAFRALIAKSKASPRGPFPG